MNDRRVINDPAFSEIARKIVTEPGFSLSGPDGARRALHRLAELTSPLQRQGLADLLIIRWLFDEYAEYKQSLVHELPAAPSNVVAGEVEKAGGEPGTPVTELRFTSESPQWQQPAASETSPQAMYSAAPIQQPPAGNETSRSQSTSSAHAGSAAADSLPGGHVPVGPQVGSAAGERAAPPRPDVLPSAPVQIQQPSRKIAAYQRMFPELAWPHEAPDGPKALADFTRGDIAHLIGQIAAQRQAWRTRNSGDEQRIEDRERLNARDRVRIAERQRNIRDAVAQEERLRAADRELEGYDLATIGELPVEALTACGFKKKVA